MSGKNTLWLYFQISTLYLDHHRALVDHGMSYILWKMFPLSWNFVFQVAQDWAFFVQVTLRFVVGWSWANFFAGYPSATEGSWGDFYRWHFTSILHWWGQHHWHHCHLFSPNWRVFLLDSFFLLDIFLLDKLKVTVARPMWLSANQVGGGGGRERAEIESSSDSEIRNCCQVRCTAA